MMIHPATRNEVDPLMIAVKQLDIEFYGKAAHASGSAYVGKNALDAQILAYNNISALRQQLQPVEKVHGIITHGGESPNIIPDYTSCLLYTSPSPRDKRQSRMPSSA